VQDTQLDSEWDDESGESEKLSQSDDEHCSKRKRKKRIEIDERTSTVSKFHVAAGVVFENTKGTVIEETASGFKILLENGEEIDTMEISHQEIGDPPPPTPSKRKKREKKVRTPISILSYSMF
jgi:hypothetical protein